MANLERYVTPPAANYGACAVWLNGDTLCSRPHGHYPGILHRAHDPSGSGQWIDYDEVDGKLVEAARKTPQTQAEVAPPPASRGPVMGRYMAVVVPVDMNGGRAFLCVTCGALVGDRIVHDGWHDTPLTP